MDSLPKRSAIRRRHGLYATMDWDSLSDKLGQFGESIGSTLKGLFGARNERMVKGLGPLVKQINELEGWAKGLSAEQFHQQTDAWKRQLAAGETTLEAVLPHAFALVREASVRTLGLRHYDVQLVGGIVLHGGKIAEMCTGEGKTLVATLPLYLNCLAGKAVYLVTVNDYLARRDAAWMGPIYDYLGVAVGAIQSDMTPTERHPVYMCDIVYGTNNEFGFDYLRDNMKQRVEDQVQRDLAYAIVDEVDSILVDEARTPLIISGPAADTSDKYKKADEVARALVRDTHFEVKEKEKAVALLEAGIEESERMVGVQSFFVPPHEDWPHFIENALRAHHIYTLDKEYVVENGEVVIVDEFTGRKMNGRRWSDGLHQAVETKEGLPPRQENQTLATITFQNYFRMFRKLAGMTGTALTEASEFHRIYKLDVVSIPTNLPIARIDATDIVFRTLPEKWRAIVKEVERVHQAGQPLLIGTTSIEKSEHLSKLLAESGVRHEVLNAKNHEREAQIVALAGERGAVTVATNMAGRGTDIKLGGNFEHRLSKALEARGLHQGDLAHLAEIDAVRAEVRAQCDKDEKEVLALGGLYVLGTERHEARRIDNQLRGRSGRQGNAGVSRFYLSLEDDLMRIFYRDGVKNAMARLGMTEDTPIESGMVGRAIAQAQKKVEERNFEIRKSLLEYDEVMNEQRKEIYGTRQDVLEGVEVREKVRTMLQRVVERAATRTHHLDAAGFRTWFQRGFGREVELDLATRATQKNGDPAPVGKFLLALHEEREQQLTPEFLRRVETYLLMKAIDDKWRDHLSAIDALKAGIGLRGYGQVDPKNEYKREGFQLFGKLFEAIEDEVTSLVMRIEVQRPPEGAQPAASGPRYISPAPRVAAQPQPAKPASAQQVPVQQPSPRQASSQTAQAQPAQSTPAQSAPAQSAPAQRPSAQPPRPAPRSAPFPLGGPSLPASRAFDAARRAGAVPPPKQGAVPPPRPGAAGDGKGQGKDKPKDG